jgi:hypothetical protein
MTDVDYPYIRAWGHMLGSRQDYIEREVQKAREANAPEDAIYASVAPGGVAKGWARYSEVTSKSTRHTMERILAEQYGVTV